MKGEKMKLNEFIDSIESELQLFKKFWIYNQKNNKNALFPFDLDESDWFEQFIIFTNFRKED
jgi:hypothetical protein